MPEASERTRIDDQHRDCLGRDVYAERSRRGAVAEPSQAPAAPASKRFLRRHRRAVLSVVFLLAAVVFVVGVLPRIADLGTTFDRLRDGDKLWLGLGVLVEALSIGGYVAGFQAVFSCHETHIDWRTSYQITLAGVVATKLFAAAGAGGLALTAWALNASGLQPRTVARRMAALQVLLYGVYMLALVIGGLGLRSGLLPGPAPFTLTVLPAVFGALVIVLVIAFRLASHGLERRLLAWSQSARRGRRLLERLATVPRTVHDGVDTAIAIVRHPPVGLLGVPAYWAFDVAALWASFHAFGSSPTITVIVMGYFVGTLGNAIPLPGGIGGVEGGMIGSFLAFGVDGGDAVLAVLAYRAVSFWLPTIPGAIAYFRLRGIVAHWREQRSERQVAIGTP